MPGTRDRAAKGDLNAELDRRIQENRDQLRVIRSRSASVFAFTIAAILEGFEGFKEVGPKEPTSLGARRFGMVALRTLQDRGEG